MSRLDISAKSFRIPVPAPLAADRIQCRNVPNSSSSRPPPNRIAWIARLLGIPATTPHHGEQWVAAIGALIGIATVVTVTHALLGRHAAVFLVPSLGATAVLIFAAPHSLFAQPWSIIAGNIVSALVGVACQQLISEPTLAAATAVALAIIAMHAARCIHPPGGATALAAVIGGPDIHQLGYGYALIPVGLNSALLIGAGILLNAPFAWRRYPASLMRYVHVESGLPRGERAPDESHIRRAMERLNVFVDVSPAELREVIEQSLALAREDRARDLPEFSVGHFYGSRRSGRHWSVREVTDLRPAKEAEHDVVYYRIVEGRGRHRPGHCTRAEFARWAGAEVQARKS